MTFKEMPPLHRNSYTQTAAILYVSSEGRKPLIMRTPPFAADYFWIKRRNTSQGTFPSPPHV